MARAGYMFLFLTNRVVIKGAAVHEDSHDVMRHSEISQNNIYGWELHALSSPYDLPRLIKSPRASCSGSKNVVIVVSYMSLKNVQWDEMVVIVTILLSLETVLLLAVGSTAFLAHPWR